MVRFLNKVNEVIINPLITLVFAIAVVYFIYSIIKLINASKEGKEIDKAKDSVFWSIIGIFIMVSVYGIINFVLASIDTPPPNYLETKLKK